LLGFVIYSVVLFVLWKADVPPSVSGALLNTYTGIGHFDPQAVVQERPSVPRERKTASPAGGPESGVDEHAEEQT
jgi:hypothetical protein